MCATSAATSLAYSAMPFVLFVKKRYAVLVVPSWYETVLHMPACCAGCSWALEILVSVPHQTVCAALLGTVRTSGVACGVNKCSLSKHLHSLPGTRGNLPQLLASCWHARCAARQLLLLYTETVFQLHAALTATKSAQ
jgi:hypothetical protein